METIKKAVLDLISVKESESLLNDFCRNKFYERHPREKVQHGAWQAYEGFDIISEFSIRIRFTYGGGDMEFNDSFIVNLEK